MTGEKLLLLSLSFIGQFINPVGREKYEQKGGGVIVILARYKFNFIRVHENQV